MPSIVVCSEEPVVFHLTLGFVVRGRCQAHLLESTHKTSVGINTRFSGKLMDKTYIEVSGLTLMQFHCLDQEKATCSDRSKIIHTICSNLRRYVYQKPWLTLHAGDQIHY